MPKGYRKRKAGNCFFQSGNTYGKGKVPLDQLSDGSQSLTESRLTDDEPSPSTGVHEEGYDLRPRPEKGEGEHNLGNRIINIEKLLDILNTLSTEHSFTKCTKVSWAVQTEVKYGLGSKLVFGCTGCGFISREIKTYTEIAGTTKAAIDTNLAVALLDSPMGISRAECLFTQLDLPFPSPSHLQDLTKKVSDSITSLNQQDMAEKRKMVEDHNRQNGAKDPSHLHLSTDARYNRPRMTSSYKPGLSSSQAYSVAMENHTPNKYILATAVENKLCKKGAEMRNKGLDVNCPGDHHGCTADMPYLMPHSERKMAYSMAADLSSDGYVVSTLTTDGDARAYLGMQDYYTANNIDCEVMRQADPNHLATRQQKKCKTSQFSSTMIPLATKKDRQAAQAVFARDVKLRCNAVIGELARIGKGDLTKMINRLPDIRSATIECYAGNCSFCPGDSLVCSGVGIGCWWYKSDVLSPAKFKYLRMNGQDKKLLESVLLMRLSEAAIYSVSSRTSTQKCESFNRATVATMSKHIGYARTFKGRLSAQVLRSNNSVDVAVKKKLGHVSGTALSVWAQRRLKHIATKSNYHKKYKSTSKYKNRRRALRARMEYEHRRLRDSGFAATDYEKGVLDDNIHTYACQ